MTAPTAARLVVLGALAAGCAGGSQPVVTGAARRTPGEDEASATGAPARWDFHPAVPETLLAVHRMSDGTCVLTSPRGQRWRVGPPASTADGAPARACTGPARASSVIAPEDLVEIVRRGPSVWLFAGESGTLYESSDPLGSLTRTMPSPEPLVKVAGAGTRVLGATADGRLLRWQDAAGWSSLDVPEGKRVLDVAATPAGAHVLLTMPEALFASDDGGGSWRKLWPDGGGGRTVGAHRLGSTADGELAAEGMLESLAIELRGAPAVARITARVLDGPGVPPLAGARAPSAAAVLAGRAALDGERYLEVLEPDDDHGAFVLARGRLEGTLATAPVPGTERCDDTAVGAAGRHVAVACVPKGAGVLRLFRSSDAGASWIPIDATLAAESGASVRLAVSSGGSILVTGACRPGGGDTCKPRAPVLVPAGVAPARAALGADLNEVLAAPAFSTDGRRAYVLGRRAKDDRIAVFVSHDGGESFASRPLDPPGSVRPDEEPPPSDGEDDDESPPRPADHDEFDPADGTLLRPGEDGTLGIVLRRPRGEVWVTTDEDGRLLAVAYPPEDDATIAGVGRRVIAVTSRSVGPASDRRDAKLWESLDGGATWNEGTTTPALEEELATGALPMTCGVGGCLLGDSVSRVGWGGSAAPARGPGGDEPLPSAGPAVRTVIACEASASSRWTRIADVHGGAPDAHRAMRGRSAWSVVTFDAKTTAVSTVNAVLPEGELGEPRFVTRTLLGRKTGVERLAVDLANQMEGFVAARVEVPLDDKGRVRTGAPMRAVEIGWENWMDGTRGAATLADVGPFERDDVVPAKGGGGYTYAPALLSVSLRGVFVRPHATVRPGARTWFVDDRGRVDSFDTPAAPDRGVRGPIKLLLDAAIVDGRPVTVAMLPDAAGTRSSVLVAGRAGDGWAASAHIVAPPRTDRRRIEASVEYGYAAGRVGLSTQAATTGHERAFGEFRAFVADGTLGPVVPVPTQIDLGERPAPCSARARASTPRVEAPMLTGTRHPVLVADPDSPTTTILMLTRAAILHGTPAAPCVAVWEAVPKSGGQRVLVGGDPGRSFLFRTAAPKEGPALEVRPLVCRFDPAARPPEAVFDEPLTIRMRR